MVSPAFAENATAAREPHTFDAVVVTAQKREENLLKVPESATALSDVEIEDMGIEGMSDLALHVPNLEFDDFGSRRHGLMFMRGIKSLPKGEPATGYYVDGVSYSKSYMFDFPLFDVQRIEVLRGPQGTLYGRNTPGGVINVLTKKPDNEMHGSVSATVGSYALAGGKGSFQTPLVEDTLFLSMAGLLESRDGYQVNDTPAGGDDGRHQDGKAGRVKLRLTPNDDLDISLNLDGQTHDDGAYPGRRTPRNSLVRNGIEGTDSRYHYSHDFEGTQDNDCWGLSLNGEYSMDAGTLTSITGYRDYQSKEYIDSDFSPLDLTRNKLLIREIPFSQEFRFSSPDDSSDLKWLAGLYFFHIDMDSDSTNYFRPGMAGNPNNPFGTGTGQRQYENENTNYGAALFGQATYTVFDQLDLTLGLRGEYEEAKTDASLVMTPDGGRAVTVNSMSDSKDYTALTPKISVAWRFAADHMVYASVAGADRAGGFNDFGAPAEHQAYDEEYSWNYEVGAKSTFLDKRLSLALAGFYTAIDDEQLPLINAANLQSYLDNAGRSHRLGVEAEAKFLPVAGLELSAAGSYVQAEFDKYYDPVTGVDYKGNRIFCVPDYTFTLAAQYRYPLQKNWDFFSRVELIGTGSRYFDNANTVEADPYELVNLKLGLEGESLAGYFYVKNLFETEYTTFENTDIGIAEDGAPMTVGVTLSYRF